MPEDFKLIPFPGKLRPEAVQPGGGDVVEAIAEWLAGAKKVSDRTSASTLSSDAKLDVMIHIKEITASMLALYLDILRDGEDAQITRAKVTAMINELRETP